MNGLRTILALMAGGVCFTGASLYYGPEAPQAAFGGFSLNMETLYAIAGVVVAMYMPEGWLKKIVLSLIKERSGQIDTETVKKLLEELDDIYPILKELYRKMAEDGAPSEQLAALKTLAMIENDKHFGVDFNEK